MIENKNNGKMKQIIASLKKENGMVSMLLHDKYFKIGLAILGFFVILALISMFYLPYNPIASTGPLWSPPSLSHPFGTTASGQDLFSQI